MADETTFNRVMIFTATKKLADILHEAMKITHEDQIGIIHSNKSQNQRFNSVNAFKAGEIRILIATDIISRGIDIDNVSHVINFDMPDNPEKYMHRIGRTGRAEEKGTAISFISEADLEVQKQIETLMNQEINILDLPEGVELTDELIPYEFPEIKMKNQLTKAPTIAKNLKGDAVKQTKTNNKKVLTRKAKIKAKRAKKMKKW
jgi:ATP-dependent RNA helicase RhlE